jgi:radical SAM PhpK family P-methyltransferase
MSHKTSLDCIVVGYNDVDFSRSLDDLKAARKYSGGFKDAKANSVIYNNERITYSTLLNRIIEKAVGKDPDLNVFKLPNLAACYLKSFLSKRGFSIEIVNFFNTGREQLADLLAESPKAVAITTTFYVDDDPIIEIVKFIRKLNTDTKILVGGPHIYNVCTHQDVATQNFIFELIGADVYVYDSQGELTLSRILKQLRDDPKQDLSSVPNLIYTSDGKGFHRTKREIENNHMDENVVDWSSFERRFYTPSVSMRTARSCAFKCSFCSFPLMAGDLNLTNLEHVQKEMRYLHEAGVKNLIFIDDTFNVPLPRFKDLCRMMINNRFEFDWYSMYRCSNSDDEAFDLLQQSGCKGVFLGIESGSQVVLKNMNKGAKKERYMDGIRKLTERGVMTLASFIVGFPGETKETINETIDFILKTRPTFYRAMLYYHDTKVPIQKEAGNYQLTGAGYSWKHKTMDWQEAAEWVEVVYKTVTNSSIFPARGFDLESIPYLMGEGFSLEQIEGFARLAREMLVKSLDHDDEVDVSAEEQQLLALFRSRVPSPALSNNLASASSPRAI